MRNAPDAANATGRDYATLSRMLADAETLCATDDALLAGQYRHLRGRIAALLELALPADAAQATS